ncbi:poly polymerase [Apiospora saccharicola]
MPPKKRTGAGRRGAAKKQKASNGDAKPSQPHIAIDEGFAESDDVRVHIDDDETIWDASLNLSNVSGNNNKFYMLQLLVDDKGTYYAHTRWGRVGESGQVKTMDFDNLDAAKEEFDSKFKSKTGLTWEQRTDEPKANKYTFVEKAYEDDEDEDDEDETEQNEDGTKGAESEVSFAAGVNILSGKSVLSRADEGSVAGHAHAEVDGTDIQTTLSSENHFNSVLEEIGYNAEKLPLGKLGKNTLKTGFEQLKELASLIKHPSLAQNKYGKDREEVIEEWTNKYYSTIPHAFGRNRPRR